MAEPLTAELRRLHVTVSRRFVAKLAAARAALSHSHPGATTEVVLEAALDLLLTAHERKRGL
ncbi:MAG: HNH endonuclease, partial [Myxococcales bacterium]